MTQPKYKFLPEHKAQLKAWGEKWTANNLSTKPMDDADRTAMVTAMDGLYLAAELKPPERRIFVDSPMTGAIAASIASGARWLRESPEECRKLFGRALTDAEVMAAIAPACAMAVDVGMKTAHGVPLEIQSTSAATDAATSAATDAATDAATRAATSAATDAATYAATDAATRADDRVVAFLLCCTRHWWKFASAGCMYSAWVGFLSFFRHIAKLELPIYDKFQHYEAATIHGGYRFMHRDFWMVADRPLTIGRDDQNRPHCDTGPQLAWRDGWSIYYVHGVKVPRRVIEEPETVTAQEVRDEPNAEVRRVMLARYGEARYLADIGAKMVHEDEFGQLFRADMGDDEPLVMVRVMNSTPEPDGSIKPYTLRVDPSARTAQDAVASTWRYSATGERVFPRAEDYRPAVET